ncbi:RHS repeat-associated core domain-containing protein, partial [Corallococcus caeni]|uniref:RHS repeat-associated core domain-containing protein n=1 Tax=Corallococcus caeni TaxID=3082388 RepID=UPI0030C6E80A
SAYEYRRFQTGASPFWTPLRFPGQYHDAETDLFENWNRFYDPSIGRYLQPEPLLHSPKYMLDMAKASMAVPAYSYAVNNPLAFIDRNGLKVVGTADRNDWWNILQDVLWDLSASTEVHNWFMECFGSDPFTDALEHNVHAVKDDWWCKLVGGKAVTNGLTGETTLCPGSNFEHPPAGPPGTQRRAIASTVMHELAHQMGPVKTNDAQTYCGGSGPVGACSADAAGEIGRNAVH